MKNIDPRLYMMIWAQFTYWNEPTECYKYVNTEKFDVNKLPKMRKDNDSQ